MTPETIRYCELVTGDIIVVDGDRAIVTRDIRSGNAVQILTEQGLYAWLIDEFLTGADATVYVTKIGHIDADAVDAMRARATGRCHGAKTAIHAEEWRALVDGPGPTEKPIVPEERTRSICLEPLA